MNATELEILKHKKRKRKLREIAEGQNVEQFSNSKENVL